MLPSGSNVVIRADASSQIGVGHVMRCLTLADRLRSIGCQVTFVCRGHNGHLQSLIRAKRYRCLLLEVQSDPSNEVQDFLGATQYQDAQEFIAALTGIGVRPTWVICDHYALDNTWHDLVRPYTDRLMVIDDLANRHYQCDLLLDPSFRREPAAYRGRVPDGCQLLLGTDFALLRSEFSRFRPQAIAKRGKHVSDFRLLVTMGGADPQNTTAKILKAFDFLKQPERFQVDVVMGNSASHLQEVRQIASASQLRVQVHTNVKNMAELMLEADLAIGASGGTSWERCCLGLPSLIVVQADNQRGIARDLHEAGVAISLGETDGLRETEVAGWVNACLTQQLRLKEMARNAFSVCDGRGGIRSLLALTNPVAADGKRLSFREVTLDDAELIFEWQQHPDTRRYARNPEAPVWEQHLAWMRGKLMKANGFFYMVMHGNEAAGILRLEPLDDEQEMEVSIFVAPGKYRLGIGLVGLRLLRLHHPDINIHAHILTENIASQRVFEAAGYDRVDDTNLVCKAIY